MASRRPVRRKAKPKNADFEYDLSNLLKMEAQGYRDSQTMATAKTIQNKKKIQEVQNNYDNVNKDCCGALVTMSKKAVERSKAHIKTDFSCVYPQKDTRPSNIFVRPMLPKIISRGDKISPKKDNSGETKESPSPSPVKTKESSLSPSPVKEVTTPKKDPVEEASKMKTEFIIMAEDNVKTDVQSNTDVSLKTEVDLKPEIESKKEGNSKTDVVNTVSPKEEQNSLKSKLNEVVKPKSLPSVVPLKFRRQSLEVMKNPLINKNITDFTKSGLKTKILVIKPIHRNKDGTQKLNTSLKFQTIKLKDPNKRCSTDNQDQVVVVKVPKVDCAITRPAPDVCNKNKELTVPASTSQSPIGNENVTKSVENNNGTSVIGLPDQEASKNPTNVEEYASNVSKDLKLIDDKSTISDDVAIIQDMIEEPVTAIGTSENVNTTV